MAEGAGEKAAGAAGGVEENFAGFGVNAVDHEGGDGAGRVVFTGIAGALQVIENLLVDVAEVLAFGEVVEVDAVDLIDDLAHELAGLHVVVGVLEDVAHDASAVAVLTGLTGDGERFQRGKQLKINEGEEGVAGHAFGVGGPGAPLEFGRNRRAVVVARELHFGVLIVDDLEEEHPAELGDALGVAVDARVLPHDVLDRFYGVANGHETLSGGLSVELSLEFVDGAFEVDAGAELPDELHGCTHGIERGDGEDAGVFEVDDALVLILLEERFQDGAGWGAVLSEDVALADTVGALAAREGGLVEGDVADEVEGVEVATDFLGEGGQGQALGREFVEDGLFALGAAPVVEEIVEAEEVFAEMPFAEVAQAFGDEAAVFVEVFDALGEDGDFDAIDVDFAARAVRGVDGDVGRFADEDGFVVAGGGGDVVVFAFAIGGARGVIGRGDGVAFVGRVDLFGRAIEFGVGEVAGGATEVHDGEVELFGVFVDAGATADDLFELGHGADGTVEDDEAAGLGVDAGGEQARSSHDDRVRGFRVNEVAELGLAVVVAAGDAHDVAVVFVAEVFIFVDEGLAHAGGVLFVDAEDDGLLQAIAAFFEELGDFAGDDFGTVVEDERAVKIFGVVDAVFNFMAVAIGLAAFGAVAVDVGIKVNADDFVGGEEAVANAFAEGVGVDGVAEVVDVRNVLGFVRRGGHTDLGGAGEVFENFAPGGVFGGAAAVALVDDDEVEEAGGEFPKELGSVFGTGDGLVEAEIDFVGGVDAAARVESEGDFGGGAVGALDGFGVRAELGHGGAEGAEVVDHGLIDEHVTVSKEEDALFAAGLPEPPDDLEGGVSLAGTGGHHEQDAVTAFGDGFDGGIDSLALVIAGGLVVAGLVIVLEDEFDLFGGEAFPGAVLGPELARWWEGIEWEGRFFLRAESGAVMKDKAVAIGGEDKGDIESGGVIESLLDAIAHGTGIYFRFDDGDGDVGFVVEDIVGALGFAARD